MTSPAWRTESRTLGLVVPLLAALLAAACGDGGSSGSPTAPTTPQPTQAAPTFSNVRSQVFQPSCVGCHTSQGRTPEGGLSLDAGVAHANVVGVPSRGNPSLALIAPNNSDGSYLLHKIEGRAGIVGSRMPLGRPNLSNDLIDLVRRWIQAGAPNN